MTHKLRVMLNGATTIIHVSISAENDRISRETNGLTRLKCIDARNVIRFRLSSIIYVCNLFSIMHKSIHMFDLAQFLQHTL